MTTNGKKEIEVLDDADLEVLLETYDILRLRAKQFKEAGQRIKDMLPAERTDGKTLKVGRFTINGSQSEGGKAISFTRNGSYSVRITAGPRLDA